MIGVLGLSTHKCKVVRLSTTRGSEGSPQTLETIVATAMPCRYDPVLPGDRFIGEQRAVEIIGRLFMDVAVQTDDGSTYIPKSKDKFFIEGQENPYEPYAIRTQFDAFAAHHYEIDLQNSANR